MGYYVQSYLTDATKVKAIFGSKNQPFLTAVTKKLSDDLDDLDDTFSDQTDDKKNATQVLTDIVNGEVRFPELAFMYVYVYEKLVQVFGKLEFPPNDEYSTDYYWDVEKDPYQTFFPLPVPADFPEVYSIANADLEEEKARFLEPVSRKGLSDEDFEVEKGDFEYIFNKAIEEKKDLVFFVY